jgi:hypothetical protein
MVWPACLAHWPFAGTIAMAFSLAKESEHQAEIVVQKI